MQVIISSSVFYMAEIILLEGFISFSDSSSDRDESIDFEIWEELFDDENHQCAPRRPIESKIL